MKKHIVLCALLLIGACFLLAGCGQEISDEELALRAAAAEAAHDFIEEKFETSPDNTGVMAYEIDAAEDFQFVEMADDLYVVRGGYQCTYGYSVEQPFLSMEVETDFFLKQDAQGGFAVEKFAANKVTSDGEKARDGWTNAIDTSSCVLFMSKEDAEAAELDLTAVTQKLSAALLMELSSPDEEKETFALAHAEASGGGLDGVDVPDGRDDVRSCWKLRSGITGSYLGYIAGLGYAAPVLQSDFGEEEQTLNLKPLYLVVKNDGYYLESAGVFAGEVEGHEKAIKS